MAYSRILVALDLTEESAEVVAAARNQLALQEKPELHLVTVIKPLNHAIGGLDGSGMAAIADLEIQLRKSVESSANKWAKELGISADAIHLKAGNPATEIKATAEEVQADLIIIGTHGQHGLGLLLGSTANGVLHGVKCDVLTVRIH